MKLIDLISVADENLEMCIWDEHDNDLTSYDGKNSIDEKYNEWQVVKILGSGAGHLIDIVIKEA